ncbi:hypothetical protein RRG08_025947 [Elysia crispata]|uniref:Uncharacterized protein n=1 Tax=Elysia crispata TaxID=231223 RepID=A0AAE1DGJ9_9GAST|nr:hypothetical protein RRG08_025947 [Elysia crispata]
MVCLIQKGGVGAGCESSNRLSTGLNMNLKNFVKTFTRDKKDPDKDLPPQLKTLKRTKTEVKLRKNTPNMGFTSLSNSLSCQITIGRSR